MERQLETLRDMIALVDKGEVARPLQERADILSWYRKLDGVGDTIDCRLLWPLFRVMFCIPPGASRTEKKFSVTSRLITPLRNRLSPYTTEKMLVVDDWLKRTATTEPQLRQILQNVMKLVINSATDKPPPNVLTIE